MIIYFQFVMFVIMIIVGMFFNPMNILAFRFDDLYFSLTLFYGGLLMASNMLWAHELVHFFAMNKFNTNLFIFGVILSILISFLLLRNQLFITDKQWLRRMISHHSTALTTSNKIMKRTKNNKIRNLAKTIIDTQEKEITLMKSFLREKKYSST